MNAKLFPQYNNIFQVEHIMDLPIKHKTIFFCEDQTPKAESKHRKLGYFHFTSLELVQTLQQFDLLVKAHEEQVNNTNPEFKLLFVIATPGSADNLINRERLAHPHVFKRIFLLGDKANCVQVKKENLEIYIVVAHTSEKTLSEAIKRIEISLMEHKQKSQFYAYKPPAENLNQSFNQSFAYGVNQHNQSIFLNVSKMPMSQSMKDYLKISFSNAANVTLNLQHSMMSQSNIHYQSMQVQPESEQGQKVSTTSIMAEVNKQEQKNYKKKQNLSNSSQINMKLWIQAGVSAQTIKKQQKITQQSIPVQSSKESHKIEQIIKQQIDQCSLDKINIKTQQEGAEQEIVNKSEQVKDDQNSFDDVERSCYSFRNHDSSQVEQENNQHEGYRPGQNVLEKLPQEDEKSQSSQSRDQKQQSNQKSHHSSEDIYDFSESEGQQSIQQEEEPEIQQPEKQIPHQSEEEKRPGEDKHKQQSQVSPIPKEQNQQKQQKQDQEIKNDKKQSEKSFGCQDQNSAHEVSLNQHSGASSKSNDGGNSSSYSKTPEFGEECQSSEQEVPEKSQQNFPAKQSSQGQVKSSLELKSDIKTNKKQSQIQPIKQQKGMVQVLKQPTQIRTQELPQISNIPKTAFQNYKLQENKTMSKKEQIKLAFQKLHRRRDRNARWENQNCYTTASEIVKRRNFFDFANSHYREQMTEVFEIEPKKVDLDQEFKSVSVIWADPNPNIGVTEALQRKFRGRVLIQKVQSVDYEVIQNMVKNPTNEYIAICNNSCFKEFITNNKFCSYPFVNCRNYIVYCMNDEYAYENIKKYDPYDRVSVTVSMDQCVKMVTDFVEEKYLKLTGREL